ncbi:PAS domain-containing protein, partial [Serratia ureilytica]|uniref:PAS domain-containing protein n=1 Tax=Serratia ureilytica TaxID=300181 RepID=UPI0034C5FBE9
GCVFKTVAQSLSRASAEVCPAQLGSGYTEQDVRVLRHGVLIQGQLEMHLYNGRETGWGLTQKLALYDAQGKIIGMAGISHELQKAKTNHPAYPRVAAIDGKIRPHHDRPSAPGGATVLAGVMGAQKERYGK